MTFVDRIAGAWDIAEGPAARCRQWSLMQLQRVLKRLAT